jgi:two-component system CheB/CheR fusion protein
MLLNGRRLEMAAGTPNLILLGVEDITERKRMEEELQQASERFRLLAETIPEKIFTARPNGERDYFNHRWLEYSGLSLDQLKDWGWTQLVHPDELAENRRVWARCIATGEPYYFEQRFRKSDGQYRWHISRAVPLKGADGMVLMWVGSDTDVHDVKESDRRKDEFLAMLAHELRNPLAPISNALQVVRHARDGQTAEKAIGMMERQVDQMARLVDELLDVSRISRGRIDLHRRQIELASVVNQAVEAARPYFESRQQELTVKLPQQPIYLDADPTRVAQIAGNLLSNASKFTEKRGRVALTVETDDSQAVMRVEDSGIGIATEQLPRIFDMFVQVDTSLERTQSGLGIGLTLVKQLVEMHGGTIEAHSGGLGKGSDFVVRLPMSAEPAPTAPSAPSEVDQAVAPVRRRVLVVDDNPDAANRLALWLEMQGHEVHTAHDGVEAVEAAATLQPDVILLDVGLPKLNGYEAGRRIRQQRRDKGLFLIALTGWGQEEDKRRSKEAGFDLHLVKPISLPTLEKLLDDVRAPK